MAGRRALYEKGALARHTPSRPCVAVGNIAWGGTGKTPFVSWLLDWAGQQSLHAVVLTRGYGAHPGGAPLLVRPDSPPEQAGDEPLLLALRHPRASVLVFPRRAESARYAESRLSPDLFILDDGMQHLAMGRHADIVLLRPEDLDAEWNAVIPSGSWREGASALGRAAAFAVKAAPEEFARLAPLVEKRLRGFGVPVFSFSLVSRGLRPVFEKCPAEENREAGAWARTPYILLSGVGNPEGLERDVAAFMGREAVQHFAFADHHPYSAADVQAVLGVSVAPLPIVCTGKDAVKLRRFGDILDGRTVLELDTGVEFGPAMFAERPFPAWWEDWWRRFGPETSV